MTAMNPTRRRILQVSTAASAAAIFSSLGTNFAHAAAAADTIKVGLIGCGGRGRGAAADAVNASENVQITHMADLFQDQMDSAFTAFAERPKAKYNVDKARCFVGWDAWQQVMASDVNLVILATPPVFRPMMIEAAINAGKHVFAEKPVAIDPAGVRRVIAADKVAKDKNLGLVAGTQRRHEPKYIEAIKRIHDGMIGDVLAGQVKWMQGGARDPFGRKPEWSDMEYQLRNWMYYVWLAGDHIVEQHMHQHDVANWVMRATPRWSVSLGGRVARTAPQFGNIYDFFSSEFEYPGGARIQSACRQMDGAWGQVGEQFVGTKGRALLSGGKIETLDGKVLWRYEAEEDVNPYEQEHKDLVDSIRLGKPLNEAETSAHSSLTAIMARISAYTGKIVQWRSAMESKLDLMPSKLAFGELPVAPVEVPSPAKTI